MSNKNVATRYIPIGLMLFALFFGAGNLIFPASMGQNSGVNVWYALIGFCITGVGMPLLAVMAMGYSGCSDLQEAAGRAHPLYGLFFTIVAYLAIGPCFAIPRTGTVAFEIAVSPFMAKEHLELGLPIFLAVFFLISFAQDAFLLIRSKLFLSLTVFNSPSFACTSFSVVYVNLIQRTLLSFENVAQR